MGLKNYLRVNLGAPYVVCSLVLLLLSAIQLSRGLKVASNTTAIFGFYLLVAGVVLQIASYVKYGEGPEPPPFITANNARMKRSRRDVRSYRWVIVGVVLAAILGISIIGFYQPARELVTPHIGPSLVINPGKPNLVKEPNGTTIVVLTAGVKGGSPPYTYSCSWQDGFRQTSSTGIFQRSFSASQTIPAYADLSVTSSEGLSGSVRITIQS